MASSRNNQDDKKKSASVRTIAELISLAGVPKGYTQTFEKFFLDTIYPQCKLVDANGKRVARGNGRGACVSLDFSEQVQDDNEIFYCVVKALDRLEKRNSAGLGKGEKDYKVDYVKKAIIVPLDLNFSRLEELLGHIDKAVKISSELEVKPVTSKIREAVKSLSGEIGLPIALKEKKSFNFDEELEERSFYIDFSSIIGQRCLFRACYAYNDSDVEGSPLFERVSEWGESLVLRFSNKYEIYENLDGAIEFIKKTYNKILHYAGLNEKSLSIQSDLGGNLSVSIKDDICIIEVGLSSYHESEVKEAVKKVISSLDDKLIFKLEIGRGSFKIEMPLNSAEKLSKKAKERSLGFKESVEKIFSVADRLDEKGIEARYSYNGVKLIIPESGLLSEHIKANYLRALKAVLPKRSIINQEDDKCIKISYSAANYLEENFVVFQKELIKPFEQKWQDKVKRVSGTKARN